MLYTVDDFCCVCIPTVFQHLFLRSLFCGGNNHLFTTVFFISPFSLDSNIYPNLQTTPRRRSPYDGTLY